MTAPTKHSRRHCSNDGGGEDMGTPYCVRSAAGNSTYFLGKYLALMYVHLGATKSRSRVEAASTSQNSSLHVLKKSNIFRCSSRGVSPSYSASKEIVHGVGPYVTRDTNIGPINFFNLDYSRP